MEQRCRCTSCNGKETFAGYFCGGCFYNWEEEAMIAADGSVRGSPCPRCLKLHAAENIRCSNPSCMAVWAPPEPDVPPPRR